MKPSRREFMQTGGALVVGLTAEAAGSPAMAQGAFATHSSHIDPSKLDSWIAVNGDGTVTAYTGKCDFGQGIHTAQVQLIAEELCVALDKVTLIACDTAVCPDQGTTSGSQSTPVNFNTANLALAAATAREALLAMAAAKLGEPAIQLTATDGVVMGARGRVSYQALIGGKHFNLPLNKAVPRISKDRRRLLGKPVPSLDRTALMTGTFPFLHNVRIPGMLHGRVVRPPGMGATVAQVDIQSVSTAPGLVKVVVRKDFVGVVAQTQYQAAEIARRLSVRWNPGPQLPAQESFFQRMQTQPSHDTLSLDSGDLDRALSAGRLLRARYTYPYQMHGSVGASCAVADVRKDKATIWSATQSAYPTRNIVATLLGLPSDRVRVIYTRGSGCYGLNGADAVTFDAAVLSQEVGRPVRLQFSRHDEMMWENLGSACVIEQRASLGEDGKISAWDREGWVAALGNRPGYDRPGNVISGRLLGYTAEPFEPKPASPPKGKLNNGSNAVPPYLAGCIDGQCSGGGTIRHERVLTRTVLSPFFTGPLRSPLRIQNTFANECFMDELCAAAKADPLAFRLAHLTDARVTGVLKAAASASGWQPRLPAARPKSGVAQGRGLACVAYEGQNGYAALVAEVDVDLDRALIHPRRFVLALDCGPVSNPDGLRNQAEGGLLQGMSRALVEEVSWDEKALTSMDWKSYPSLHLDYDVPAIECVFVEPDNVPAAGAGETALTVTPAAIGNAVFDAIGVRLRDVPFTSARLRTAIQQATSEEQHA